jgi:hypothetical protein
VEVETVLTVAKMWGFSTYYSSMDSLVHLSADVWPVISTGVALTTEEVILYCNPENDAFIK